ncbi:ANTAR domain-containing protein, partial [Streptomyces sp. NPDC029006]|uniref:ANTAR domain-containing protein n=1 Tax=Streptomyces sp. NPDC029006 TaxID=3155467 RepID=UPI0033F6696F
MVLPGIPAAGIPAVDVVLPEIPAADVPATSPVGRLAATVERLRREVRAAQAEAEGRALVELAKGILVERLGCGPAQAARQLAELTEQAQMTPLEFAVEVINQAARDRVSEVTEAFLSAAAAGGPPRPPAPRAGRRPARRGRGPERLLPR